MLDFEINESILKAYSKVKKTQINEVGPIAIPIVWAVKDVIAALVAAGAATALVSQAPSITKQLNNLKLPYEDGVRWLKDLVSSTPISAEQAKRERLLRKIDADTTALRLEKNSNRNTVGNVESPILVKPPQSSPNPNNSDIAKTATDLAKSYLISKGGEIVGDKLEQKGHPHLGKGVKLASDIIAIRNGAKNIITDGLSHKNRLIPFVTSIGGGVAADKFIEDEKTRNAVKNVTDITLFGAKAPLWNSAVDTVLSFEPVDKAIDKAIDIGYSFFDDEQSLDNEQTETVEEEDTKETADHTVEQPQPVEKDGWDDEGNYTFTIEY